MTRSVRVAIALVLAALALGVLFGAVAWSQMSQPPGVGVLEGGVSEGRGLNLDFDATDFDVACPTSTCSVAIGAGVMLDNGGQVGASADFESTVDLSSKTLLTPNGTADRSATCSPGTLYTETDDTAVTTNGTTICHTTDAPVWLGDITSGGQSGGQSITGGTANTDDLTLNPTSNTTPLGGSSLRLCANAPTYTDGTPTSFQCLSLWPSGYTFNVGSSDRVFGIDGTGTWTQASTSNLPGATGLLGATITYDLVGSAPQFGGGLNGIYLDFTYQNSNTVGPVSIANIYSLDASFSCLKGGSGVAFTMPTVQPVRQSLGTIATGCTVTDFFSGGYASTSGTVSGTLTNWWGFKSANPGVGTNRFQFAADEHTITGTVPSGVGVWGVEAGSPNRFYFKNESGHIWRMGYTTWTTTCTALTTTTASAEQFCLGVSAPVATAASAAAVGTVDEPGPGALKVYAMAVSLSAAPATTSVRTFRLFVAGSAASPALSCTITGSATTCNGRLEAGAPATAGQVIAVGEDITIANAAAATATITLWWNLDAF